MAVIWGKKVVTDSLILYHDIANINSFHGEPTVNLSNVTGLVANYGWVNSGAYTLNTDETDVLKPRYLGLPTSCKIISGIVTTTGSIMFGCGYKGGLTPSTTYTMSVYYRQSRAGCGAPYLRTAVNNNSLGNFSYNGSTNSATWPVNEWIRITKTATTQANETGLYLSNYIGNTIADKVWYLGQQLEQKDHVTPLVAGTRGATVATDGGCIDLSGNNSNGELVNDVLYNSNNLGSLTYDGTSSYLKSTYGAGINPYTNPISVTLWIKPNSLSDAMFCSTGQGRGNADGNQRFYLSIYNSNWDWGIKTSSWGSGNVAANTSWNMITITMDPTNNVARFYLNANEIYTKSINDTYVLNDAFWLATHDPNYYFPGEIAIFMIHQKMLSVNEIKQNFNALKKRFGL